MNGKINKKVNEMKKLRIKKEYGLWYYEKICPSWENDLDAPIYYLYDSEMELIASFGTYYQMAAAIKYGDIEEYINRWG